MSGRRQKRRQPAVELDRIGDLLVSGGYWIIAAAALLPILVEHMANPAGAYGTLASILGGIGGNLIANIAQGEYEKARTETSEYDVVKLAALLEKQIRSNDDTSKAIALLVHESGAVQQAIDALRDFPQQWEVFSERLLDQTKDLSGTDIIIENLKVDHLTIIRPELAPNTESLIIDYLHSLATTTDHLRLGTIDPKFEIDTPIKLSQVYIDPDVQETMQFSSVTSTGPRNALTIISNAFGKDDAAGVVLLGGPGAGKTSFIDRLANSLALNLIEILQHGELSNGSVRDKGWTASLVLPVRVSLQDFAARSLPANAMQGAAGFLWEHVIEKLRDNAMAEFDVPLKRMLRGEMDATGGVPDLEKHGPGNGCLVLLDGLDEVPQHKRQLVEQSISEFSYRFSRSVVVVTCRTYSWHQRLEDSPSKVRSSPLDRFGAYEFTTFSEDQISRFVQRWYAAVQSLKHLTTETVQYRIASLTEATKLPSLASLSERPLLLTLMATLHTSRGQLPHDRATLYANCVDLLLEVWQRAKDLHVGGRITVEGGLLEEFGVRSPDVERVLRKVAYELHISGKRTEPQSDWEPRLTADQLRKAFRPLVANSWDEADRLVSYLERRAGLLEYEGDDVYRFPHRTFLEFLAACYLLDEPDAPSSLIRLFLSQPAWWSEVFSLAVGRQSCTGYSQAVHILYDTLQKMIDVSTYGADPYGTLLGTARDIGLADRQVDSPFYYDLLHSLIRAFMSHSSFSLDSRVMPERGSIFRSFSKVVIPHVFPLLEDAKAGNAAAVHMGAYGEAARELEEKLYSEMTHKLLLLLEHDDPLVRARAAHVLGGLESEVAIERIISLIREDEPIEVVVEAAKALGKLGGYKALDEEVILEMYRHARDADIDVARALINALYAIACEEGSVASEKAIECLISLLDNDELAIFSADALIDIGEPVVLQVRDLYENTDDYELIEHLRYILSSLRYKGGLLWRERDRDYTDQFSYELQDSDWP
jgi:hypothetical protein